MTKLTRFFCKQCSSLSQLAGESDPAFEVTEHTMDAKLTNYSQFVNLMGCFNANQAPRDLTNLAASVGYGWIVMVGSQESKSAVALWTGAKSRGLQTEPAVYCVASKAKLKAFYRTLNKSGAHEGVTLLDQSSENLTSGWNRPLGLLLIDGDKSYENVKRDFECWDRHLVHGGRIVFEVAAEPGTGPTRLIKEILATGDYTTESEYKKMVILRKQFHDDLPPEFSIPKSLNVLVACSRLLPRGGYLRFERVATELRKQGHTLTFATLVDEPDEQWRGQAPIIGLSSAFQRNWDITMIPGVAGFSNPKTRRILQAFRAPNFGFRLQHILNDKSRSDGFKAVNHFFRPHLVLFNNHYWRPGEYTRFQANQFRCLLGAVDVRLFSEIPSRPTPLPGQCIWVGAQCQKHPGELLDIISQLPDNYNMRLFGPSGDLPIKGKQLIESGRLDLVGCVYGQELRNFYDSVDLVLSIESAAGWANSGAEALASGKPLICTKPGTTTFAIHNETAIVVERLDAKQFASEIQKLVSNRDLLEKIRFNGRNKIATPSWEQYTRQLIGLCRQARTSHYYHAPMLNLHGKWPLKMRLGGLKPILDDCQDNTVLDLGAAEGTIARIVSNDDASNSPGSAIHVFKRPKVSRHFVSFPKSGRSWIRYALYKCGVEDQIQFQHDNFEFNSSDRSPHEFSVDERKKKYSSVDRIVYLQRHPMDVMASFYHQITGRFQDYHAYTGTPSEFIRDPYFGALVLHRFRSMWLHLAKSDNVLLLTYEECHADFEVVLKYVLKHFNLDCNPTVTIQAAESASFENMKQVEVGGDFSDPWLRPRNDSLKVRNGKIGGYRELFSDEDIEYMESIFGTIKQPKLSVLPGRQEYPRGRG